jgi:DNA polymerase III subunit gamma/tau
MSYLVLARKFRPQQFQSIIGQEHITRALSTAILRNRVPHALLFTGPRGVGKTSAARVFARALNCTARTQDAPELVEPCGECVNCIEISKSVSIAVWEIDGASNNSVDNVRELIESLSSQPPPGSKYKIYIIDEVHMLSTAAFNALLKSLEEPPPNTIFIFATTEPHKIPETVISRCQRHDFRMLPFHAIASQLKSIAEIEGVKADEEVFEFLARRAGGSMRDSQSMLDRLFAFSEDNLTLSFAQQVFGILDSSFFFKVSEAVLKQEPQTCFQLLDEAFQQSLDIKAFISDFISHFRNLMVLSISLEGKSSVHDAVYQKMLDLTNAEFLELKNQIITSSGFDFLRLFDIAEKTAQTAILSNYPHFVLEAGLAKMATLPALRPLGDIIDNFQQILSSGKASPTSRQIMKPSAQAQKANPSEELSSARVVPPADFDPSWQDFVKHVQSRSEMILAAFLRRVSPIKFILGELHLSASVFDLSSLKDSNSLQTLKDCLYSYSGREDWQVHLFESSELKEKPTRPSIAVQQAKKSAELTKKIEQEAIQDPLVQTALQTFGGSKIEKVSVLNTERAK